MLTALAKGLVTACALALVPITMANGATAPAPVQPDPQVNPQPVPPSALHTNPPSIRLRTIRLAAEHPGYTVNVRYPRFLGSPPATIARLNKLVKRTVNMNIAAQPGQDGDTSTYSCDYHVALITPQLVSIDFQFTEYQGGAHDRTFHVPFNYQLQPTPRPLTLRTLLGKRVDYAALSRACLAGLPPAQRNDFSAISRDPTLVKQASWTFDKKKLILTFSQGAVGAEADDCPVSKIPYSSIRKMFSRQFPVYSYAAPSLRKPFTTP